MTTRRTRRAACLCTALLVSLALAPATAAGGGSRSFTWSLTPDPPVAGQPVGVAVEGTCLPGDPGGYALVELKRSVEATDDGGELPVGTYVVPVDLDGWWQLDVDIVADMPPGDFLLRVSCGDDILVGEEWFEIARPVDFVATRSPATADLRETWTLHLEGSGCNTDRVRWGASYAALDVPDAAHPPSTPAAGVAAVRADGTWSADATIPGIDSWPVEGFTGDTLDLWPVAACEKGSVDGDGPYRAVYDLPAIVVTLSEDDTTGTTVDEPDVDPEVEDPPLTPPARPTGGTPTYTG